MEEKDIDVRLVIKSGDPLHRMFEYLKREQGLHSNAEMVRVAIARLYDIRTR